MPLKPQTLFLKPAPDVPNNEVLPVLLYKRVLKEDVKDKAAAFEKHFGESGWKGTWRNGIYGYHHFHPNAHEALGIARGHVTVQIGGETGEQVELEEGDLVVLPAGTGHKRIKGSANLLVIGTYPPGQEDNDICKSRTECMNADAMTAGVGVPETDPFYGADGPLLSLWK